MKKLYKELFYFILFLLTIFGTIFFFLNKAYSPMSALIIFGTINFIAIDFVYLYNWKEILNIEKGLREADRGEFVGQKEIDNILSRKNKEK